MLPHMYSISPAGCDDVIHLVVDSQQTSEHPAHSGNPSSSSLAGRRPGVLSSQQSAAMINADQGDLSQHFNCGCYWDGPQRQTQSCVCIYGQREPECVGHCWPGSPCIYYGGEFSPPSGSVCIGQDNVQRQIFYINHYFPTFLPTFLIVVRRNLVVGVELVEEVAVEDTVEVM